MHFGPPRGGWNSLGHGVGGSKTMTSHLNMRLSFKHVAAGATAGEAAGRPLADGQLSLKDKFVAALQRFPVKAAVTAGALAVTGDTIAQFVERIKKRNAIEEATKGMSPCCQKKKIDATPLWAHDYVRALRMASYGFLFYGPFSHMWYGYLDRQLPARSLPNFLIKVGANQVILGPLVVVVVFAYNFAWMNRLPDLPAKYRNDMLPTLVDGWKFWIPVALLNFGVVPLPARVAFMSSASIFWNFYLSMSIGKAQPQVAASSAAGEKSKELEAPLVVTNST